VFLAFVFNPLAFYTIGHFKEQKIIIIATKDGNFAAVVLDFKISGFQSLRDLWGLTVHPHNKFRRNRTIHGGVIVIQICSIWVPSAILDLIGS